jgi:hypothetical protein
MATRLDPEERDRRNRERNARYYKKHCNRILAEKAAYREANREKRRADYQANREAFAACARAWRKSKKQKGDHV